MGEEQDNTEHPTSEKQLLYCYNIIYAKRDSSADRGALMRALTICCTHQYFHIYKTFMWECLLAYYEQNDLQLIIDLYNTMNQINVKRTLECKKNLEFWWETSIEIKNFYISTDQLPIAIPMNYLPDEVYDTSISFLLRIFKEQIMVIHEYILQEKRVVFLGYDQPVSVVCRAVQSSLLLANPMHMLLQYRAYPYVNLGYFEFLNSNGYIIGVTNPFLKKKGNEYWDVLCDISTGQVFTNERKSLFDSLTATKETAATNFIKMILQNKKPSEEWVRNSFYQYNIDILKSVTRGITPEKFQNFANTRGYQIWLSNYRERNAYINADDNYRKIKKMCIELKKTNDPSKYILLGVLLTKIANISMEKLMQCFGIIRMYKVPFFEEINASIEFPLRLKRKLLTLWQQVYLYEAKLLTNDL
eukprot:TRINITY_DN281_c2_g4_i2.p1 TRINITY_DN281_c2_g4~~TRINITY_DN281_c2_g4_i2.p1  ORF type:complete len:416 (+),score=65.17 TRINITY_DN281_c2_g4_i2:192-1439(+)